MAYMECLGYNTILYMFTSQESTSPGREGWARIVKRLTLTVKHFHYRTAGPGLLALLEAWNSAALAMDEDGPCAGTVRWSTVERVHGDAKKGIP